LEFYCISTGPGCDINKLKREICASIMIYTSFSNNECTHARRPNHNFFDLPAVHAVQSQLVLSLSNHVTVSEKHLRHPPIPLCVDIDSFHWIIH